MTPGDLPVGIPPTVATFIWFSGARGSLTRVTSDSHAKRILPCHQLASSPGSATGARLPSPSLTRTMVVVSIAWVSLGVGPDDVT